MENLLVSIIVPTKNRPQLLKKALKSILNQRYPHFEVIVINDGGLDVDFIIRELNDSRILYIQYEHSKGPSAARNTALAIAKGKYIAYLDDDDLFYPNHLETLVKALEANPEYELAYTDWFNTYSCNSNTEIPTQQKKLFSWEALWPDLLIDNRLPPSAVMHTRACLDRVGRFDESLRRHEDWDLWIRLCEKHAFLHLPLGTVEYIRGYSGDNSQSLTQWLGFFLNTLQMIHVRYRHLPCVFPDILEKQYAARNRLRHLSMEQLEQMPDEELEELYAKKIIREIVDSSLFLNHEDDLRGTRVFTNFFTQKLPFHSELWLLHARLSRLLGDVMLASIAINRALQLESTPEIIQELSSQKPQSKA